MFPSVQQLQSKFDEAGYIVDSVTIQQVYVAGVLQKPILIEGPPGCGKTELMDGGARSYREILGLSETG